MKKTNAQSETVSTQEWIAFFLTSLTCILAYLPGLHGPFLLDDLNNLNGLGLNGGIKDLQDWWNYVASGFSGPLGRPVSLASFTLNSQNWPADPFYFKLTNLLLHIGNGLLLFLLLRKLLSFLTLPERPGHHLLPVIISALWLLHPLQVSTVLYVVQRMTILSATFTLLGLLAYTSFLQKHTIINWKTLLPAIAIGVSFTILATFSKENGILLPLYMALITALYSSGKPKHRGSLVYAWIAMLALSPIAVMLFEFIKHDFYSSSYEFRNFNLYERLLTETRVLVVYVSEILRPSLNIGSLYNDDIPISRDLFTPPSTLLCLAALFSTLSFSYIYRKTYPWVFFGIFWFLIGHLLESTVFPLELYFEHRNYLPSLGIIFSSAIALYIALYKFTSFRFIFIAPVFLLLLATLTYMQANYWSEEGKLINRWAEIRPESVRSQLAAARMALLKEHNPDLAMSYLLRTWRHHSNSLNVRIRILQLHCLTSKSFVNIDTLKNGIDALDYEPGSISGIGEIVRLSTRNKCRRLSPEFIVHTIDTLLGNKHVSGKKLNIPVLTLYKAEELLYVKKYSDIAPLLEAQHSPELDAYYEILMAEASLQLGDTLSARHHLEVASHSRAMLDMRYKNKYNTIASAIRTRKEQ